MKGSELKKIPKLIESERIRILSYGYKRQAESIDRLENEVSKLRMSMKIIANNTGNKQAMLDNQRGQDRVERTEEDNLL